MYSDKKSVAKVGPTFFRLKHMVAEHRFRPALMVLAAVLLPISVIANKAIVVAAALCALAVLVSRPRLPGASERVFILPGLLIAWSALSLLWAVDFGAASAVYRLILIFLMTLILHAELVRFDAGQRSALLRQSLWGCLAAMGLLTLATFNPGNILPFDNKEPIYWLNKIKPGSTLIAIFVWPAAIYAWRRWSLGHALALVALAAIVLGPGEARTAKLALSAGLVVFLAALICRRWVSWALAIMIGASTLLAPILASQPMKHPEYLESVPSSGRHRMVIWDFVAERIAERPLLGWGYNSSRAIPGGNTRITGGEILPLHPHNAPLQVWLELGLPGAALTALILVGMIVAVGRWQRDAGAGALATFSATWVVASLSYGIWQQWWLCAIVVSLLLCRALTIPDPHPADRDSP